MVHLEAVWSQCIKAVTSCLFQRNLYALPHRWGTCRSAVGWGTVLQAGGLWVRFSMTSLEFFIDSNPGHIMAMGSTQPVTDTNHHHHHHHHHHQFLLSLRGHRTSTKQHHLVLFPAILLTSFQLFPFSNASLWTVLCHVCLGLPLLLFPCGFQSKASLSMAYVLSSVYVLSNSISVSWSAWTSRFPLSFS